MSPEEIEARIEAARALSDHFRDVTPDDLAWREDGAMQVTWSDGRQAAYDPEYLRSISPVFHAENIVKPLMVLQGANDPRVVKAESDDIVAAARANGAPVEYIVFDDEGHGFKKRENKLRGYRAVLEFLDEHLKGDAAAAASAG